MYNKALQTFCINTSQLNEILKIEVDDEQLYGYLCLFSVDNFDIRNDILLILRLITRKHVSFDEFNKIFIIHYKKSDCVLDFNTFLKIQTVVKIRNGLGSLEEDDENPADIRTKRLLEQRKKYRNKLREAKTDADSLNITIADLLGSLASALHLELSKIYEYDMYQISDQIGRIKNSKDYDTNIQALLHGADSKDVNLKYWICRNKANDYDDSDENIDSDNYEF
jgi:hypothetical protein